MQSQQIRRASYATTSCGDFRMRRAYY